MTSLALRADRPMVSAAILASATAAALLGAAAIALSEPRIIVAAATLVLVAVVARLPEPAAIRLLVVMLAVQGFPAYFTGYFPTGTLFADDAVALVIVAAWLARTIRRGEYIRTIGAVGGCVIVLGGYIAASIVLHRQTPWQAQLFAAWQLAYLWPVGFIAASTLKSAADVRRMLTFLWRLAWIQVLAVAIEWPVLYFAGFFTAVPPVDWFAGTLGKGAAHVLGIWIGMMTLVAIALWIHGVVTRGQAILAILGFLFVLISGSTRQMYVVLPAAIACMVAVSPMRMLTRVLLVVTVPLLLLGFFRVYSVATQMSFSLENLVLKQQQNTRLAFYTHSWRVARDRGSILEGQGPGSYASTAGLRFGSPLAKQAAQAFPHDATMVSATGWPVLFVELGALGLAALVTVFGAIAWRMLLIARRGRHGLTRALALAGLGGLLVLTGSAFGSRSFEYMLPSLHVWLVCGMAAAMYGSERQALASADAQPQGLGTE